MSFGEALKATRKELDMTQKEFSKIIGCTVNTLVKYERGSYVPDEKKQSAILGKVALYIEEEEKRIEEEIDRSRRYREEAERDSINAQISVNILKTFFPEYGMDYDEKENQYYFYNRYTDEVGVYLSKYLAKNQLSKLYNEIREAIHKCLLTGGYIACGDLGEGCPDNDILTTFLKESATN